VTATPASRDVYASIRRTAARALLESATLDVAVAEILRALSTELDWPLALYWISAPDDRALQCRSIWASDALKRADIVEASRVTVVSEHAHEDPARRAVDRQEALWIDDLSEAPAAAARVRLARSAGLTCLALFPIGDGAGGVGAIEVYGPRARPRDEAMLALMAEVGLEICEMFRREQSQATALEAVSRSRDELEQVLATLPDGITLFNGQGQIIYANDAAGRAMGFAAGAELMRTTIDEIGRRVQLWDDAGQVVPPEDWPSALAFRGRRVKKLVRYRGVDEASEHWAVVEAVPLLDERRAVHRVVHIVHDMTNQHRIEQENIRLVGEAQEALRAREDLLAIVSHDLRNPLGVVLASSALLLKSNLPPDKQERARRQVEAIQRAGNRMNRLIRDLLDFASIQAGRLSVSVRPQDVGAMVSEVLEVMEPLAAPKSLRLVAEVAPDLAIRCDHDRVIQLFSNLVGNAVKFTPDGGTITVRAVRDGDIVRFSVVDTGPGISADELPHVFDRYYQAQRKNRDGIGLGLSIARGIVEAHGGRIWVESEEGKGCTFFFTLAPATPPAHQS
jgi:signal transduction histidine kinase